MTNLLLDMLKASAPSRVVTVSGDIYAYTNMHWEDLMLEEEGSYGPVLAYAQSKLANIMFSAELGRRLLGMYTTHDVLLAHLAKHIHLST